MHILFVCTGNSSRSQIGEILLRSYLEKHNFTDVIVRSAGTVLNSCVNPCVYPVLEARGFSKEYLEALKPKHVNDMLEYCPKWDIVITVCSNAQDNCPRILFDQPGTTHHHWDLPDPAAVDEAHGERQAAYFETAVEIDRRIRDMVSQPDWPLRAVGTVDGDDPWAEDRDEEGNVVFNVGVFDADGNDIFMIRCSDCDRIIEEGEPRLKCMDCESMQLCKSCNCNGKCPHTSHDTVNIKHQLVEEFEHPVWLHVAVRGKSPAEMIVNACRIYAWRPFLGTMNCEGSAFDFLSYEEVFQRVLRIAHRLREILHTSETDEHEKKNQKVVAIYSTNSIAWILCDFACTLNGDIVLGLSPSYASEDIESVLNASSADLLLCSDELMHVHAHMHMQLDGARHITRMSLNELTLTGLDGEGGDLNYLNDHSADDVFTYICTSGTTGRPKLAKIRNSVWVKDVDQPAYLFPYVDYSWLPLAHGTGRISYWTAMANGGRVGIASNAGTAKMMYDIEVLKPTILLAPPMFWTALLSEYENGTSGDLNVIRKKLGGRLLYCGTGMAKVGPAVLSFIQRLFPDAMVQEGYGTTEVGGIAVNGIINADVSVKLVDVDGYTSADLPYPRGEICVLSRTAFDGYVDAEFADGHADTDEYFHTGDIGCLLPGNRLEVIDRVGAAVKLSNGEWLAPGRAESDMIELCPSIQQMMLIVNCNANSNSNEEDEIIAVVVSKQPASTIAVEIRDAANILSLNTSSGRPNRLILTTEEWTVENGLLTGTGKLNRRKLNEKYARAGAGAGASTINLSDSALYPSTPALHTTTPVLSKLIDIVSSVCNDSSTSMPIDPSASFLTLGNSISGIVFVARIEKEWPVLRQFQSIYLITKPFEHIAALIEQKCAHRFVDATQHRESSELAAMMDGDCEKGLDLDTCARLGLDGICDGIFVTGATGYVGRFVLLELLKQIEKQVISLYILVRNDASKDKLFDFLHSQNIDGKLIDGITVVEGSLEQANLGLNADIINVLAKNVSQIIHIGAQVDFYLPYSTLRKTNVEGTRNLLQLFMQIRTRLHFHHISTLSVLGDRLGTTPVPAPIPLSEKAADMGMGMAADGSNSGYAQSKWVAEKVVSSAYNHHHRFNTIRLGLVTWPVSSSLSSSSPSAHLNLNETDWISRLLLDALDRRCYPALKESDIQLTLTLCPVDAVARDIVRVVLDSEVDQGDDGRHEYYHFYDHDDIDNALAQTALTTTLSAVYDALAQDDSMDCAPIVPIPLDEWLDGVYRLEAQSRVFPILPLVQSLFASSSSTPSSTPSRTENDQNLRRYVSKFVCMYYHLILKLV